MVKGITATQEGVGIDRALDSQKTLDSRWRYFEIVYEKILTTGTVSFGVVTDLFTHGLGFLPAFDCYDITTGSYIIGDLTGGLRSSTTKIYFQGQDASNVNHSNHKVLLRIYNVPMTEEYTAPIQQTLPSQKRTPSRQGIKIARGTTDFTDLELSKYSLNTSSKSLSIQKTGTVTANSGTSFLAVIRHDLGLPPTYMAAFVDSKFQWISAIDTSSAPFKSSADGVNLTFRGAQSALTGTFAYIIFKELGEFAV